MAEKTVGHLAPADVIGTGVGPVLQSTPLARFMIEAMEEEHPGLFVEDAGAYYRVFAPGVCRLRKEVVDEIAGRDVAFPRELEVILSSFTGRMQMNQSGAVWWSAREDVPAAPGSEDARSVAQ
ncbi:MAG: toluene 4-monooxygenase protein [Marmoricola sp.]|jgi:hypothetical protein|nr:toluene 4-monooxygenase protein [Marmoricola sp.]